MRFLICGTLVPAEYETRIEHLSNAGNRFLMNFCQALSKQEELKVASYLGIPVPFEVRDALEKEKKNIWNISYHFASKYKLKGICAYARSVRAHLKESDCVVAYNATYAWIFLPLLAKSMKKKSVLLLADYSPEESYTSRVRKIYADMQLKSIRKYNYVVGLSENVQRYLKTGQHFMCMEGGITQDFFDYFEKEKPCVGGKIRIQYAGILEPVTGVDRLVRAFREIESPNYELRISGKGSMKSWIEEMAALDKRIQYLGCPSYEKYMKNIYEADILVNPRNMELKENANNFPSKIMEYLATGKRIVSTRFPGWKRYKEHIAFCESDVDSIKKRIVEEAECALKQEINLFEERRKFARRFIWEMQIESFLMFLKDVD